MRSCGSRLAGTSLANCYHNNNIIIRFHSDSSRVKDCGRRSGAIAAPFSASERNAMAGAATAMPKVIRGDADAAAAVRTHLRFRLFNRL